MSDETMPPEPPMPFANLPLSAREERVILATAYMIAASSTTTRAVLMASIMGIPKEAHQDMINALSTGAAAEAWSLFENAKKLIEQAVENGRKGDPKP